jgi:hypothetical protein
MQTGAFWSMNYDSKIAPQVPLLFNNFQTKGRLKSHSVPREQSGFLQTAVSKSERLKSKLTETVAPVRFRYSS